MKFRSIKGTRDILPAESYRWHALEEGIRSVMHAFNYKEIRTPVFEETALFARSIGELTDIVGKEMYTFEDRSETSLTLKPEMTASVIRAYIQNNLGEQQPLVKTYYLAPMFRQERPQAGRLRQFHQFGAEAIGGPGAEVDAEIIALACEVYRKAGIQNTLLKVNSVGCEKCRPAYKEKLQTFLRSVLDSLSEESKRRIEENPMRILDSKDERDRELTQNAPLLKDHLCDECAAHFRQLEDALTLLKLSYVVDGRIVRGLDYYTKTAFEIVSTDLGSQDALAGGGRYDLLTSELGGKATPAVGFAAGMERLLMVMERQGVTQEDHVHPQLYLVAADDAGRAWVLETAMNLRSCGIRCEIDLLKRSIKAQMRDADRQRSNFVAVIGATELQQRQLKLKSMTGGGERLVPFEELLTAVQPSGRK